MTRNLLTVRRGGKLYNYFRPSTLEQRQSFPPVRLSDDPAEALQQAAELCRLAGRPEFREIYPRVSGLLKAGRTRARSEGADFRLLPVDVIQVLAGQEGRCALCGLPLDFQSGEELANPLAPRLHRIDPAKPYMRENLRVVSLAAGQVVDDWGLAMLHRLAVAIAPMLDQKAGDKVLTASGEVVAVMRSSRNPSSKYQGRAPDA